MEWSFVDRELYPCNKKVIHQCYCLFWFYLWQCQKLFLAGCALILYTIMNLIIRRYGCRICPRRSTEQPIRGRFSEPPLRMPNRKENLRLESDLIQLKGIAESLELHDSVAHFPAVPQQDNDDQKFYKLALDCMVGIISKPHSIELPVEHMTNRQGQFQL